MSQQLRPYQVKAEKEIFAAWKAENKSIMFQLCTGGGKTVLFVSIIKKFILAGKRVVLIAHREELITQAWQILYKHEIYAGIIKSGVTENFHLPCQVASIQTICRRNLLPKANLVIIDESHHSQNDNTYGDALLRHWPYAYVLGVTATPYRLGGKGFTSLFNLLICGPPFRDLVAKGWLVPFKYLVAYNPNLTKVKTQKGDYVIDDLYKAMRLAPIVESYLDHCQGMSGICFAVNIEHSRQIVKKYIEAGVTAAHVDANTDLNVRRKLLQDLKDKKIMVLVNVGIATEGTDVPSCDFVQLARPTKSLSLFLQMVGRGTRVLYEAIKGIEDDQERRLAVRLSSKPHCIVLDNAGCYLEHGLPDRPIDWETHFQGTWEEHKKKKTDEVIEIIEFIAEDEDGGVVTSRVPDEVLGLKLREVNYIEKEKIVNLTSLKEFDRNYEQLKRLPQLVDKKIGFIAYRNYFEFCKKNSLLMSAEVWKYLYKRMVTEPAEEQARVQKSFKMNCDIINQNNAPHVAKQLIEAATDLHNKKINKLLLCSVPKSFLQAEQNKYIAQNQNVFA